jgi:hypothetical protein
MNTASDTTEDSWQKFLKGSVTLCNATNERGQSCAGRGCGFCWGTGLADIERTSPSKEVR